MSDTPKPVLSKHFTSLILLWMRADEPRQDGMAGETGRARAPSGPARKPWSGSTTPSQS
ncbi:hypothetical protein [Arthrobacter dokdonensis]|uniref:hypothetical protein n=1 Tax=Arthrobacter dokdonellae TaxID=2211210 RepID=UPI00149434E1|nr:hypothetical protein [Arthrobacter dokdonellae]